MLDLPGKERPPPGKAPVIVSAATPSKPTMPASPTALVLDSWALRRGKELLEASAVIQGLSLGEDAIADFHAAAFLPDHRLAEACVDPRRRQFLAHLLGTPEFRALHASTMLREDASEVAAAAFAEQYAKLKEEDAGKGEKGAPSGKGADGGRDSAPGDDSAGEMSALRAAGKALAAAAEEVESLREGCAALGMGPGSPGSNDPKAIAEMFRRVRDDPALRRICELAGRFRRVAQSRQRMKSSHGVDEVVGIETGGDLARLLPSELARLALPELEMDTLRRLAERQCQQREMRGFEPAGKGPVLVCVDESGSMSGEKGHAAKALALAMAWVARRQRRWCAVVAYSGDSGERLLALPPGRWDEAALVEWLSEFIGKGSDIDIPVREMPRMHAELKAPPGKTDVLFVTDAQVRLPAAVRDGFLAWKRQAKARLVTLVIQGNPGDLDAISDEVHLVRSLAAEEDAVGRALSF
jgi:uncharacterized protein with von Willebrand factor type A (vWA) domain